MPYFILWPKQTMEWNVLLADLALGMFNLVMHQSSMA